MLVKVAEWWKVTTSVGSAAVVIAAGRIAYLSLRRRFRAAGKTLLRLLIFVSAYMLVLVGFSLAEPRKDVPVGMPRCFDDWCITVEQAAPLAAIGTTQADGTFYVVTLRVSSRARGRRQREPDVDVYLIDEEIREVLIQLGNGRELSAARANILSA